MGTEVVADALRWALAGSSVVVFFLAAWVLSLAFWQQRRKYASPYHIWVISSSHLLLVASAVTSVMLDLGEAFNPLLVVLLVALVLSSSALAELGWKLRQRMKEE